MTNSPPQILIQYLVTAGLATKPSAPGIWPASYGGIDADNSDDWILVKSVTGLNEGKLQKSGVSIIKPRVQIQTRSTGHGTAENKLISLLEILSPLKREAVAIGSSNYLIHSITIIMPTAFLMEEEKNLRQIYVATVQLTLSQE